MWEQIRSNRRRSIVMVLTLFFVLIVIGFIGGEAAYPGAGLIGVGVAVIIFAVQLGTYFFAAESILMQGMGAQELTRQECPRLFNIIEEMQLASGLGYLPAVYLIDEPAPNAF